MYYICIIYVLYMYYICIIYVLYMYYICIIYVLYMGTWIPDITLSGDMIHSIQLCNCTFVLILASTAKITRQHRPINVVSQLWIEPETLRSHVTHASHYATKATIYIFCSYTNTIRYVNLNKFISTSILTCQVRIKHFALLLTIKRQKRLRHCSRRPSYLVEIFQSIC